MRRLFEKIKRAAKSDVSIYISGETGVGKELVARAIHEASNRAGEPFIAVNVANFSSDLIESQLFGHKKGAFTGAVSDSSGLMQTAGNGTLFLDEVACLPVNTQAKLLRVLQEKQYYPVGDTNLKKFSASVVSASNLSLEEAIKHHQFREDLRYRLEVIPLVVPPLRDRSDDILVLFEYFLQQASNSKDWNIGSQLKAKLMDYQWPGNVRELENCARFASVMASGSTLTVSDLPDSIQTAFELNPESKQPQLNPETISKALILNRNNRNKAAEYLGVSRMTLWRKMKAYNLI